MLPCRINVLLCLQLFDLRMIGNLVHPLDDSIHQRVKTLHDVQLLLKTLHDRHFGLEVLDPLGDLLHLSWVLLHSCVHLLSHAYQIRSHLINDFLGLTLVS